MYVGIDVGGSKIRVLASTDPREFVEIDIEAPTRIDVASQVCELIEEVACGPPEHVAIGVPGVVDPLTGDVSRVPFAPSLSGIRLTQTIFERFGTTATVENDLNAAAYGIYADMTSKPESLLVVGAGTGIGLGIVIHGQVIRGQTGAAGEVADLHYQDCSLENALNSRALIDHSYDFADVPQAVRATLTSALEGDNSAIQRVDRYANALAYTLIQLHTIFDPEAIVLTGGIMSATAMQQAVELHLKSTRCATRVQFAQRGAAAPAWGALLLAAQLA